MKLGIIGAMDVEVATLKEKMQQVTVATHAGSEYFEGKLEATYDLLHSDAGFVCLHVEAPDECTHNGDLPGKIQSIEWIDSRILTPLLQRLDEEKMEYRVLLPVPLYLLSDRQRCQRYMGISEWW